MTELRIDLDSPPGETLERLAAVADAWGAEWRADAWGGRLALPVRAGLRVGRLGFRVGVEARDGGSTLRLEPESHQWAVHWQAAIILLFGAFGGGIALAWPFFPRLLGLAPLGILLSLAAWFLVASRLRSSGPEEFLAAVAATGDERDG